MPDITTSTIQLYTDAFISTLRALPFFHGIQITDGPPPVGIQQLAEFIMVGDVTGDQQFAAIGKKAKDEVYNIDVLIDVVHSGRADQAVVSARVFEILAQIENVLRADPQIGVSNIIHSAVEGPIRLYKHADDQSRGSALLIGIVVRARI